MNRNHGAWQPANRVYVAPERINPGCVGHQAPKPCEHVQLSFNWKGGE